MNEPRYIAPSVGTWHICAYGEMPDKFIESASCDIAQLNDIADPLNSTR